MNPWFETHVTTRSYEMDAFGHLNHAVYLNYFEVARIRLLEEVGFPVQELLGRGWGVHVVRVEVDYRKEAFMGERVRIRTRLHHTRRSRVTVAQQIVRDRPEGPEILCEARVTWVWVAENGRPQRVPEGVLRALEEGPTVTSGEGKPSEDPEPPG